MRRTKIIGLKKKVDELEYELDKLKFGFWVDELDKVDEIRHDKMENMQYAEELVREFLVFRGFTNTLQAFEMELSTDIGKGFQVDKILDLIFSVYVPKFQAEKLIGLLGFFKQCFSSSSETVLTATFSKLEVSILRYYIVHALQSGKKDKVVEFFEVNGNDLLQRGQDWTAWFAIPYMKNPHIDPQFRIYFSKEWYEALRISVKNFFSQLFNGTHILLIWIFCLTGGKRDPVMLPKEVILSFNAESIADANAWRTKISTPSSGMHEENLRLSTNTQETSATATAHLGESEPGQKWVFSVPAKTLSSTTASKSGHDSSSPPMLVDDVTASDTIQMYYDGSYTGRNDNACRKKQALSKKYENGREIQREEDFPEVKIDFQDTFLGHTSPISRCRFSASGDNIASASVDGTVRIWTHDSTTSASRNATIYCGAEIMSLDWECKSNRLLLIGTADGGIKAWNVDAKRVVCDLNTTEAFPSVLDLKCSPVEPIFVSASASGRYGSSYNDSWGFASLTVWNMKTWKAMTVLPLGEDPPAITSLCFNHNGKILAASAVDGMIHMFCDPETSKQCRHEMALDANGRRLLVTSSSVRGNANGLITLPHSAAITTVDWHPTLPIFLTGSADNSVRVTSIL
ncbi:hypothetical protein JRO89_XS11G0210400 [Xanthoceras sorbifolium]|uniref:ARMC9 CTLH-like domain-containing protein n=1 Tax=Xanthoceras sorbifolium TaxID=99658 RepID=A0ABQ8HGK4_9ROSI|nr:hypothetical protein JRO89_XS11G0210400 [Xanthoceras sorbifolium]